jgi:hypothetical protein
VWALGKCRHSVHTFLTDYDSRASRLLTKFTYTVLVPCAAGHRCWWWILRLRAPAHAGQVSGTLSTLFLTDCDSRESRLLTNLHMLCTLYNVQDIDADDEFYDSEPLPVLGRCRALCPHFFNWLWFARIALVNYRTMCRILMQMMNSTTRSPCLSWAGVGHSTHSKVYSLLFTLWNWFPLLFFQSFVCCCRHIYKSLWKNYLLMN